MYNQGMKMISTTIARQKIGQVINEVKRSGHSVGLGRHGQIEVMLIKYPDYLNQKLDELTNFIANAGSFDFLKDEPDLYSVSDLKKRYV